MTGQPKLSKLSDEAIAVAEQILRLASGQGRRMLFEHEVYTILAGMGLTVPVHVVVTNPNQINDALLTPFRTRKVVLKVIAGEVSHKERVGGVQVVSKDPERVRTAFEIMTRNFIDQGICVQGVLLVQWISYSRELGNEALLGFRESETFGPVISLSKGGTDAEHFANHFSSPNLILAPIDGRWARALLESTHIYQKYVGRGLSQYVERMVDAAVRFSDLALSFSNYFNNHTQFVISEFEVNPFVFTPDRRFVALDGLARFEERKVPAIDLSVKPKETIKPWMLHRGL